MPLRIENQHGIEITTIEEWKRLAPPKNANHWRQNRSAMESARAWFRNGIAAVPAELRKLLSTLSETRSCMVTRAFPEVRVSFDKCGGNVRNADVVFEAGIVAGTIEAKTDEPFGKKTVGKELIDVEDNPGSRLPERIDLLSAALFDRLPDDDIKRLQYQLLFSIGATVVTARERRAKLAVFIVHEFLSPGLNAKKLSDNAAALDLFVSMFPEWAKERLSCGQLLPPITLHGNNFIPSDLPVTIGKIQYQLP